jgi:hypothetical protein
MPTLVPLTPEAEWLPAFVDLAAILSPELLVPAQRAFEVYIR